MPVRKTKKEHDLVIGAHVRGGCTGAVQHALEIGAQAMQIFIGSPQSWKGPSLQQTDLRHFAGQVSENGLGPVFVHGNYLVNLAALTQEHWLKSVDNLTTALRLADHAEAAGLIFHPGSAAGLGYTQAMRRVVEALEAILEDYRGRSRLLLEVCAGQGQTIGDRFEQFGEILSAMGHDQRLGVCWDTCHLFNAGYDVSTADGLKRTIDEFDRAVGFEWLAAIHANDSKTPLGARRDRHENIGKGCIGEEGFRRMLNHPLLRPLPWILEVPGFDGKGPDQKNIRILHRLAKRACAEEVEMPPKLVKS